MSADRNTATQERLAELVNSGAVHRLDEVFAESVIDHDPAPGQRHGPEGFKDFFATMRSAFPDLHIESDVSVTDDDHVCVAYTMSGTHEGTFHGIAGTGRRIEARGVQIARFDSSGKIAERWGSSDELSILNQLGAEPTTD